MQGIFVSYIFDKINKLSTWQVAMIIAVVGLVVFSTSLTNPFQGDDAGQIVSNVPVHLITNIRLFFEGSTFYSGQGLAPLGGVYFRPLMTTVFSLVYTFFGPHPIYFHIFQILICIGSTIFLYLFLRYSFKPDLALFLSLIFLVHPMNSETALAIPVTQDTLFFFFGILALYLSVRFKSITSLLFVSFCLLLSLFAKETGVLFVAMTTAYLFKWDRKRLYPFFGMLVIPMLLYLVLRVHAVGLLGNQPNSSPIQRLGLDGRLLTAPSIVLFYLAKFIFPWKLATSYFWVYRKFTVMHVLTPLLIDCAIVTIFVYAGMRIYVRATAAIFYTYLFFSLWLNLGLLFVMQIFPLDSTASEAWFYFPMVGLLGMLGVIVTVFPLHLRPQLIYVLAISVLLILGFRTAMRGFDWRSPYQLAIMDTNNSQDNFRADYIVEDFMQDKGQYQSALPYAEAGTESGPSYSGFVSLATIYTNLGDYPQAQTAYSYSLKYATPSTVNQTYEGYCALALLSDSVSSYGKCLYGVGKAVPRDSTAWLYLSFIEVKKHNSTNARLAVTKADMYGQVPQQIYDAIINNQPISINVAGEQISV
jgi:hypothetical protein